MCRRRLIAAFLVTEKKKKKKAKVSIEYHLNKVLNIHREHYTAVGEIKLILFI